VIGHRAADDGLEDVRLAAAQVAVNLLVAGEFLVLERMTAGRLLSATDLEVAVDRLGADLVPIPAWAWRRLRSTALLPDVIGQESTGHRMVVPLWSGEGPFGAEVELRLIPTGYSTFEVEIHAVRRSG